MILLYCHQQLALIKSVLKLSPFCFASLSVLRSKKCNSLLILLICKTCLNCKYRQAHVCSVMMCSLGISNVASFFMKGLVVFKMWWNKAF